MDQMRRARYIVTNGIVEAFLKKNHHNKNFPDVCSLLGCR